MVIHDVVVVVTGVKQSQLLVCPWSLTMLQNRIRTVHILHHHVRGGWGVQAQMMTLMVPLGGVEGLRQNDDVLTL